MPKKLPSKLAKEPLLEAVCELWVDADVSLHTVVPGVLYSTLKGVTSVENLPISNVPPEVRATLPGLSGAPLVRLHWENCFVLCGPKSIAVASKLPYPGWKDFKPKICEIFKSVLKLSGIRTIERYSVKYVNLVQEPNVNAQHTLLDWQLIVGEQAVKAGPVQLRCEMSGPDGMVTVLQIGTAAVVQLSNAREPPLAGCIVDADTVMSHKTADVPGFVDQLSDRLEAVKAENKKWVFECLKQSVIDAMGPSYEQ